MVLVDTSVWVDHLRRGDKHLAGLLRNGEVVTHPFIVGELACGNLSGRSRVIDLLQALPQASVATQDEVMTFIDRQELSGKGLGFVDVHLLASSLLSHAPLWTRDRKLRSVAALLRTAHKR